MYVWVCSLLSGVSWWGCLVSMLGTRNGNDVEQGCPSQGCKASNYTYEGTTPRPTRAYPRAELATDWFHHSSARGFPCHNISLS